MIDTGRQFLSTAWWLTAIPGLFIFWAVMSFNAFGDWARVRELMTGLSYAGNEAARRYLAWETGLVDRLDLKERAA